MLLIEERLSAAKAHRSAGRNDNAALLYEWVLDINPSNKEALKSLGDIRFAEGDYETAMNFASRAGDDADALSLLAKAAMLCGREAVATTAVDRALELDPHHIPASKFKASTLWKDGDQRSAERLLIDRLRLFPDDPELLGALSQMYMSDGLPVPALEYSRRALERHPDNTDLMVLVGTQLCELGSHAEALPLLERAHLLQPGNILLLSYLSETHLGIGQVTEAHRLAKRAVTLMPQALPVWQAYVKVMAHRGESEAAIRELIAVARQHPEKINAALTLAGAYRLCGEPAQALRLLQPLLAKLATMTSGQKSAAVTLVRDCCLSLGLFDQVAKSLPQLDLAAAIGFASQHAATDAAALASALAETSILVDGSLSSLEAMLLLRFSLTETPDATADIRGPSSLREFVELMPNRRFIADDAPDEGNEQKLIRAVPLSAMLSLPEVMQRGRAAAIPYIAAPLDQRAVWRRSLRDLPRPLVALCWDATRPGLLLDDYRRLFDGFKGTLIGLAWDDARHQLRDWPEVIDAGVHFASLADLAAVIAETDAVIGPDGIPLHMAGAMGAKAALLTLPNWSWCWHSQAGVSSWYPSVKVLQTQGFGHWSEKIAELAPAIDDVLNALVPTDEGGE